MPTQNIPQVKDRILYYLKTKGPSLPIHISKAIGYNLLFSSAFISEMLSEKSVKMSHMRIGSSPLYFLEGQESMLERFSEHLKSREKDAFNLLKEKKLLKDSEQEPAIRVALRAIRDFAIPFTHNEEGYWKYFTASEGELGIKPVAIEMKITALEKPVEEIAAERPQVGIAEIVEIKNNEIEKEPENIPGAEIKAPKAKSRVKKREPRKSKQDEKFLEKVKEFLSKSSVEIINVEGFKNDEISLLVKIKGEEQILFAYKKRKITDADIVKAAKKAEKLKMKYSILSPGELPKKISELMEALKGIKEIKKME
ncbi:hypothetical protein HY449_03895 [Candidatus Pacearchaeota archaeon]|nr:hypothetical protein [Candidatus Pacearchaeota archaeon]